MGEQAEQHPALKLPSGFRVQVGVEGVGAVAVLAFSAAELDTRTVDEQARHIHERGLELEASLLARHPGLKGFPRRWGVLYQGGEWCVRVWCEPPP
jgi:hypothetical protein